VHETVKGKALDRAIVVASRLTKQSPVSIAYIKRLVKEAMSRPLEEGLRLERNLFMMLASGEEALERMKALVAGSTTITPADDKD
jgi:enoyl-CoA hydratase/carnithine racemase